MPFRTSKFLVKYTQKISAIRVLDTELFPVWLTVSGELVGSVPLDSLEFRLGIAKIDFWFTNLVHNSFMFSLENEWALDLEPPINIPLVSPYEPTDDVLATLFSCKCNALAAGAFEISFFAVENDNSSMSFTYADDELPDLPTFDDCRTYYEHPWWHRDDSSTFDILPDEDDDVNNPPDFFFVVFPVFSVSISGVVLFRIRHSITTIVSWEFLSTPWHITFIRASVCFTENPKASASASPTLSICLITHLLPCIYSTRIPRGIPIESSHPYSSAVGSKEASPSPVPSRKEASSWPNIGSSDI